MDFIIVKCRKYNSQRLFASVNPVVVGERWFDEFIWITSFLSSPHIFARKVSLREISAAARNLFDVKFDEIRSQSSIWCRMSGQVTSSTNRHDCKDRKNCFPSQTVQICIISRKQNCWVLSNLTYLPQADFDDYNRGASLEDGNLWMQWIESTFSSFSFLAVNCETENLESVERNEFPKRFLSAGRCAPRRARNLISSCATLSICRLELWSRFPVTTFLCNEQLVCV